MSRFQSARACLLVGLVSGCATTGPASEPATAAEAAAPEQAVALGLDVYRRQYCGVCHTLDTAETRGSFGPTHNGMGATAQSRVDDPRYTGTATTAEAYLRESILTPEAYLVPGFEHARARMPAYTNLSEEEVQALVHLLLRER